MVLEWLFLSEVELQLINVRGKIFDDLSELGKVGQRAVQALDIEFLWFGNQSLKGVQRVIGIVLAFVNEF